MTTCKHMGVFGVRNDKFRGLIIECLELKGDTYFFKYNDQSVDRHCEQIQQIMRTANIKRAKKITVDVTPFIYEYYNVGTNTVVFRGNNLNSTMQQIRKVQTKAINQEIRLIKRKNTMEINKQAKVEEKIARLSEQSTVEEEKFQLERARRISELFEEREQMAACEVECLPNTSTMSHAMLDNVELSDSDF